MRITRLLSIIIVLWPTLRADEKFPKDFFSERVNRLPICDRVEVIRLDSPETPMEKPNLRSETPHIRLLKESELTDAFKRTHYQIWPPEAWCKKLGTKTLKNEEAVRFAALFRAFQEYRHDEGTGWSICHNPPYAFRFYSGEKLLEEVSICWKCHNILFSPGREGQFVYFKEEAKEAQQLLEASNKLFPEKVADEESPPAAAE